jgi:hypothetical protein
MILNREISGKNTKKRLWQYCEHKRTALSFKKAEVTHQRIESIPSLLALFSKYCIIMIISV